MSEFLEFAEELAEQIGVYMVAARNEKVRVNKKPDRTLVTNVDHAINDLVIDAVLASFPDHTVISEEGSHGSPDADHIWRIDPLDGTHEYIRDKDPSLMTCGFGLAKQCQGILEVGLFFNPFRDELFTAVRGLGAHLNGQAIRVNDKQFVPGIAYDYSHWDSTEPDVRFLDDRLGQPLDDHSAIYQGCMVALGKSAFSIFPGHTAHDIAPAAIIVTEARGTVSNLAGQPHDWNSPSCHGAIFSNGVTHSQIITALEC